MFNPKAILFLCSLSAVALFAQKGTHSPYSVFGIGELNTNRYAPFSAMGGTQMANTDSTIVNSQNPAMYSYLLRNRPVFQIGINGRFSRFETANAFVDKRNFMINQFQLGLPIKKRWGAAIGIMPYSFSGYTVNNYVVEDSDTTQQYVNEGSGGISKAYVGVSVRPLEKTFNDTTFRKHGKIMADGKSVVKIDTLIVQRTHMLSLGVNGNYLFGSAIRKRSFEYVWPIVGYNARVEKALRLSDFNVDFGLNYQYFFRSDSSAGSFSIGMCYTPARKVRAYEDIFAYTYSGSFYETNRPLYVYDTIQFVQDNKGVILIPEAYKIGMEYRFGPGKDSKGQLRLAADLKYQRWANYYEDFGQGTTYDPLKDRMTASFGLEYVPNAPGKFNSNLPIMNRISYRLGFNYTQTEWQVQNELGNLQQITDYGMSFGFGIPIAINFMNTNINFGATFGNLGSTENGLIRERYIGTYFGFSLTPGRGNYWFVKRKYD